MAIIKKIILLALSTLVMAGCDENDLKKKVTHATESIKNRPLLTSGMIVTLDSCQYVVCNAYGGWAYIHHNNCRFCKERRQKELEELVIKLKEN